MRTWSGGCGSEYHWAATEIERAALRARPENSLTGERCYWSLEHAFKRFNDIYKIKYVSTALLMISRNIPPLRDFHRHFSNLQANAYQTAPFSAVNQAHR
jgi:hypothetical protein